jgi:WD40 repeat protein
MVIAGPTLAVDMEHQNRIRLWNLVANEEIAWLDEPDGGFPVAFSGDGSSLLSLGIHHARLFQLHVPEKLELPPHPGPVLDVAFSPDGQRLASISENRLIRVCDALTGRTLWETNDPPGGGRCLGFSPDGRWLAVGDWETGRTWIRDALTGQRLLELGTNRAGGIVSAQFSPDARYLATGGIGANHVSLWAIEGGKPGQANANLEAKLLKSTRHGMSIVFAPDSRSLAFLLGEPFDELYVWDFERSDEPRHVGPPIIGSEECVDYTPDGRQLLMMDTGGELVTLDAATGKPVSSFHAVNPQLASLTLMLRLSPDGSKLALTSSSASGIGVDVWDPKAARLLYSLPPQAGAVNRLAWTPDSRRLAVAHDNGTIAIWNLETVNQILAQLGLNP